MKKYKLTQNSIEIDNRTLYQIRAFKDFGFVKKGDLGGFIESENNLNHDGNCWISGNAKVYGNVWVSENAQIYENARAYGKAEVSGNARVSGNAWVSENARVSGDTHIFENAHVYGYARLGNVPIDFDCSFDPYKTLKEILNCPEIFSVLSGVNKNLDKLISTILTKTGT